MLGGREGGLGKIVSNGLASHLGGGGGGGMEKRINSSIKDHFGPSAYLNVHQ